MYFVYILQSTKDKRFYVSLTADLKKRVSYHNARRVRSTKNRAPFILIHSEAFNTRTEARQREKYLKSYKGSKEKLSIVENCRVV